MGEDFISWQNLCPIPFVNLTNKIIINYNVLILSYCFPTQVRCIRCNIMW